MLRLQGQKHFLNKSVNFKTRFETFDEHQFKLLNIFNDLPNYILFLCYK